MKIKLDAQSYQYKQLKDFFGAKNKDHLIYLLLQAFQDKKDKKEYDEYNHLLIENYLERSIDLNEMFTMIEIKSV
tara:strand:- start:1032 stop:1256 length:225 start_codon:yes stop_codon:yes gene_type:complete